SFPVAIDGVPDGYEAFLLADLADRLDGPLVFIVRDGQRVPGLVETLAFVRPGLPVLDLPAWDCLPYDRVSPGPDAAGRRLGALMAMAALREAPHRAIVIVTANALLQRVPPRTELLRQSFSARAGARVDMDELVRRLAALGFDRTGTVREPGEFAVRGGIVDLFASGAEEPVRLDFFGDELESIRSFDPATQRTTGQQREVRLLPMSEVSLDEESVRRFRR